MGRRHRSAAHRDGRALAKKYGIFLISAVVVTLSTVFLYTFISTARAAERSEQELMQPVAEETPPAPAQPPQPTAAPTPMPKPTAAGRVLAPIHSVELAEGSLDPNVAIDYGFMTMDEAAEEAAWLAENWLGIDVSGALIKANLAIGDYGEIVEGTWLINIYCADRETRVFASFIADKRIVSNLEIYKEYLDYAFEGKEFPDAYREYRMEPAFLDKEEYAQAVRECTKAAKEFTLKNMADEFGIKQIYANNEYRYSADEYRGGNRVALEIALNDGSAFMLEYICRKGEEPMLVRMYTTVYYD